MQPHRRFQILSFQIFFLVLCFMKKFDFNSGVHEALATMLEKCLKIGCFILRYQHLVRPHKDGATPTIETEVTEWKLCHGKEVNETVDERQLGTKSK